jgi:sterol desaturase/sphingolipid hydroxylase (fatty acid hydroxylase superfamily)
MAIFSALPDEKWYNFIPMTKDWAERIWQKAISIAGWDNFHVSQIYLFVGITIAGFVIEMAFIGWRDSSLRRLLHPGRSEATDIWMWALSMFNLNRIFGVLFTFGICYYAAGRASTLWHLDLIVRIHSPALQLLLLLLIGDLKNYGRHYLFHHLSPLWMAHRFHHSADEFTMITHHRNHFLENAIGILFDVIPFVILGSSPQEFFLVQALRDLHQMLVHGRWRSDWGLLGRYVLVSPNAHLVHHSVSEKHYGKNFGSLFIFWDRIFRTYEAPVAIEMIGLPGSGYNDRGFLHDYWLAYRTAAMRLWIVMRRKQ